MKTKYYIAYGSNMDEEQMAYRCPEAKLIGKSEIKNYELLFKGSKTGSYATVEPKRGSRVPVLIWEISERDEVRLDLYEGFPSFYYKKNLRPIVNGKRITAMIYIMDEKRNLGIPTNYYYNTLAKAYRRFRFDSDILENAYEKSIEAVMANDKQRKAQ